MPDNNEITCPHCHKSFALQDSLADIVKSQLDTEKKRMDDEAKLREKKIEEKVRKEIQDKENLQKLDLQNQLSEQIKAIKTKDEMLLRAMQESREAKILKDNMNIEIEKQAILLAQQEKEKTQTALAEQYEAKISIQAKDIEKKFAGQFEQQQQRILLLEKEKEDTQKKLEEAKRASSQISQQAQGEILELEFERRLKEHFPEDAIEEVPKGIEGADYIQRVFNKGKEAGIILWETKNTKGFSKQWIEKLKNDQRKLIADMAIIATNTLPKESPSLNEIDGVYVVSLAMALPVAILLRGAVIKISEQAIANEGTEEKAVIMYQYLTSNPFRQKIEAIISAYQRLASDTDREERAMKKIWAERRKYLQKVLDATAEMYGELQAIAGKEIPTIQELELDNSLAIEED